MSRTVSMTRRAAVAFGLAALMHVCRADTGTVASANPYATIKVAGPLTQDSFSCPFSMGLEGCTLYWDYWISAQCFAPQANPRNWPNNTASLITYNPGANIYNDMSLSGQLVYSGPGPLSSTQYSPSASASVTTNGMQVNFTYTQYLSQSCSTNPLFPAGIWCSTSPTQGSMTLLDCTGPTVNVDITCPSNQVPSTSSPWNNGCGCAGGSCKVDFSDPNSMCQCGCGADADDVTCSTDCSGNACGTLQCDGTCDTSNCDASCGSGSGGCVYYQGWSCGSGVYDCWGNCNTSGNGSGGDTNDCGGNIYDGCGGCCDNTECQEVST
jgi:hypothetical protein